MHGKLWELKGEERGTSEGVQLFGRLIPDMMKTLIAMVMVLFSILSVPFFASMFLSSLSSLLFFSAYFSILLLCRPPPPPTTTTTSSSFLLQLSSFV